ncbi:unnamed protein product [Cuscuta epithymum]|uniref:SMP-LTD domain-containing protein n=1 Tax=Cuscuta epithymum TaxID=186058 RepID=A0AAV0BY22_9ASTE|nr:unnamed protein product [Cuscuta epithymum]
MWALVMVFVLGALTVVGAEAVGLVILIRWLNRRVAHEVARSRIPRNLSSRGNVDPSLYNKQGFVWVLDAENIPRASPMEKALRQQKVKKEILEVTPVKKHAKLNQHSLVLAESDASYTEIELKGCTIAAVSATDLSSRKWAKRYPIKVESKSSAIYKGSKTIYLYNETSWEKESWCKALYLASCEDAEKLKWFIKLNIEFQNYVMSLNAVYPSSFMKSFPRMSIERIDNKSNKPDVSSSKVRNFLRKLSKKTSKSGVENKPNLLLNSSRDVPTEKSIDCSTEEVTASSSLETLTGPGGRNHLAVISNADSSDDRASSGGTACWNLLISRLFFDAKQNAEIRTSLQARIQRTLSNMRIPTYIGEVICTAVDLGNLPPYFHAMRALPSSTNEDWVMEIDIEYSGGAIFEIETRLEVQDLELEEGGPGLESSSVDEVKADLLEGIEQYRENLKYSEETADDDDHRDEGDLRADSIKHSRNTTGAASQNSRWKSIVQSIAKQVSQVPLSLGVRVASLRGLLRIFIKPPPSDQMWFGFTSMPDLDFQMEPFIGEHRIASGRLALFLISRFKVAIRDTLVLPNCESICLPWMLAEKEDWVPRKLAPFIWISQEPRSTDNADEATPETASRSLEGTHEGPPENTMSSWEKPNDSLDTQSSSSSAPLKIGNPDKELRVPLLSCEEQVASHHSKSAEEEVGQNYVCEEDEKKMRKLGSTKARMIGLSKKMSEKIDEKRRHIEEKGRNIVERMRGGQQQ